MTEKVFYALAVVVLGLAVAALLGALTRRIVTRRTSHRSVPDIGRPAGALVFWVVLAVGIAAGVGILAPGTLEPLAGRVLGYLPRLLVAILMLVVGGALATLAGTLVSAGLARATGRTRREMAVILRGTIMVVVVLLALGQLGVNTQVLTLTFAAVLLCLAVGMALLIGLGGRTVARDVAAGRYVRRIVVVGDRVVSGDLEGTVVALHAATAELETEGPGTVHVPHSMLLRRPLEVTHPRSGHEDQTS